MKTIHDTIGDFRITSNTEENCLPNWKNLSFMLGIFGILLSSTITASLTISTGVVPISGMGFMFLFYVTLFLPYLFKNCGTRISIEKLRSLDYIKTTTYQFTKDPELDAREIQETINECREYATRLAAREIEKKTCTQSCQDQYKNILEKIQHDNH